MASRYRSFKRYTVAVVGGGCVGMTTAYELLQSGYEVTLYDYFWPQCSYANGGQLSLCNAPVWNSPKSILKAFKYLFKKKSPIKLPWTNPIWFAKFLGQSIHHSKNTGEILRYGRMARKRMKNILETEKIEFDHGNGILKIFKHDPQWSVFDGMEADYYKRADHFCNQLNGYYQGMHYPQDGFGDANLFTKSLLEVLKKDSRFIFKRENVTRIGGNYVTAGENNSYFDRIVLCAGLRSRNLSKECKRQILPVRGYSITIPCPEIKLPKMSILDDEAKIVATPLGNRLRVVGLAEFGKDWLDEENIKKFKILLDWTRKHFPGISINEYSTYVCHRPMTPSMVPIVKRSKKNPFLYLNTGHGHLGWTLCCGTAYEIVNKINNE